MGNIAISSAREKMKSCQHPPPAAAPPQTVPTAFCLEPAVPAPPTAHSETLNQLPGPRSAAVVSVIAASTVTPANVVPIFAEAALTKTRRER